MIGRQTSIQRKLISAIMLTSITVVLLTALGFVSYELITFRGRLERYTSTIGTIIADSTALNLRLGDQKTAQQALATVGAERHIVAAALYKANGALFVYWPTNLSPAQLPRAPESDGFRYEGKFLDLFHPVLERKQRVGTLYLCADFGARQRRLGSYAMITMVVLGASVLTAWLLSKVLARGISQPLLSLAETAKAVSTRRDYSVRAAKFNNDEVGALTDAFNHMLTQIEERDATVRQSEERFRQLANAVLAFVWTSDSTGAAVYFNEPWYQYTGRSPTDSLGLKWIETLHEEDRDRYLHAWDQAVEQKSMFQMEGRIRRADGKYRWFLSRAHPALDARGEILTWFGTSVDIQENKHYEERISRLNVSLEQRVRERTAQLEVSNRELEAFSYSVAHDLRAPLRGVDGFNQALLEDYGKLLPEEGRDLIRRARQASHRMAQLIDDLLNLSRVTRAELRRQQINLSEIAQALAAEMQKIEPQRKVTVRIQTGVTATGDERLLRVVMENLLGNAFKFTRNNAESLIEFGTVMQDGNRVLFVRDNGAGFNMEHAGKLFGPFQRLHSATEYPGTGIGLATVQRILNRHGGRIWAESDVGKGTMFYFTLPG